MWHAFAKQPMTKISESSDYHDMDQHNAEVAKARLIEMMDVFGVTEEELLDFMYNLKTVKTHGWGHVQIIVQAGSVERVEALIRTKKFSFDTTVKRDQTDS